MSPALRFAGWPLRAKLAIFVILATAVPVALSALVAFREVREVAERDARALLEARADEVAARLEAFHENELNAVRRLAASPSIIELLDPGPDPDGERARVEAVIRIPSASDPHVHSAGIFDTDGTLLVGTAPGTVGRNYLYRGYLQEALAGRPAISDMYVSTPETGSTPLVTYSAPVMDGGRIAGAVVLFVHARAVWDVVRAGDGRAGAGSYSVLYDSAGLQIAHSFRSDELFRPGGRLSLETIERLVAQQRFGARTRELLESPIDAPEEFARARASGGTSVFRTDGAGGEPGRLTVARPLRVVPWTLFYAIPDSTIAAAATTVAQRSMVVNAGIVAAALLAGLLVANRIIRPVRAISDAAERIAAGDFAARVTVLSRDEIGALGARFNEMGAALAAAYESLEQKVRERTADFERANEQLAARNAALAAQTAHMGRRQSREAAFARALAALGGEGDLTAVLERALREAATPALDAPPVVLACFRADADTLVFAGGYAAPRDLRARRIPIAGIVEEALSAGKPIVVGSIPPDLDLRFEAVLASGRPRAITLVPLLAGDRRVGLLAAGTLGPISDDALGLLADLAPPLALAIARNDLQREMARTAEELAERNLELQQKAREVERANDLKSEFLANMSHELRTPLNAVIGFSELILEESREALGPKHAKYVEDILASGRHLLLLINDILDLAKIEAGRMTLAFDDVEPESAIAEARTFVEASALRRRMEICADVRTRRAVRADRAKLRQVLVNLLSNAVKFAPEGTSIQVSADDVGSFVRFRVHDEGPGIDPELRRRLFTPFVQGESALVKKHQGTGLGLAISKRLVEAHGGTIEVERSPERGSTFAFTIPAAARAEPPPPRGREAPAPAAAADPAAGEAHATGPLVLIVEDDLASSRLLREYLETGGYHVIEARDARSGLESAERLRPAAILLDLVMDEMDGLALLRELKSRPATRDIPVVIESVLSDRERGLTLGAADYFVKPIPREPLLERLRALTSPPSDGREPLVLAVDDDPEALEFVRAAVEGAGYRFLGAGTGRAGIDAAIRERPHLVIVDLALPDMSGLEVIDALGLDERTRARPTILLTAAELADEERERIRKRALALIEKRGFTREGLLAAVERALGGRPDAPPAGGPTVLVVDDHDLNRDLVRSMLERAGRRVVVAQDGEEAVEVARRERPALIIMDLAMPRKDGYAAARELRAAPETASIPLVALTALAMKADQEKAREAGFDAYLTKPIDRGALEATVERFLSRGRPAPASS